ncbi:MAG: hypothetical protein WC655_15935 [Candidatus Hydrogenedentales bacterium]
MRETVQPMRLYTPREASAILGLPSEMIRQLIRGRYLKAKRIHPNAHARIPGHVLIAFVSKLEQETVDEQAVC